MKQKNTKTPSRTPPMGEKEKEKEKEKNKKPKHQHPNDQTTKQSSSSDFSFKRSSDVKGIRFGTQFIVKSFTVRRSTPLELLKLLSFPPTNKLSHKLPFPSTTTFLPTNFTILAHHAWHTLTLGLGTKKSKVLLFVFESEAIKGSVDRIWPHEIALGEVNKKLIRALSGFEMSRFKFRKGCITFYVYAVRQIGSFGFSCAEDLRTILQSVVDLKDFLDHTVMLSMPNQRTISYSHNNHNNSQVAMAH